MHPDGRNEEQVGLGVLARRVRAARKSFHVTLHRLRKALRNPMITLSNDRYRSTGDHRSEFDVARFEREVGSARRRAQRGGRRVAALERAVARFPGGDLWTARRREDWGLEQRDRCSVVRSTP